ncbi:hypothetical protein SAMN06295879_1509 [Agreia bicolorata]|uniref:Lipoprotein n=1 Tax=Agreia bicolorata TaxID=110935 RepID=A0A1T4XPV1_9MICO|nr:hypothetical protein [Agreia bicolorata]KJC65182.1 hypothetical protein TZ00_06560 [Agreia bicolorata]SKA91590.1 hypothetical protein SAMN06295879_1509 [Agreia bicolorata]
MKRRLLVAAPVLAMTALLSGCTLANAINPPIESAIYATQPEASGATGNVALPDFVQADATTIRIKTDTADNTKILGYSIPAPLAAPIGSDCASASTPALDDTWWVESIPTDAAITCSGDWHIYVVGQNIFAWTP